MLGNNHEIADDRELEQLEETLRDDRRTTWIGVGLVLGTFAGAALGIVSGNVNLGVVGGAAAGALMGAALGMALGSRAKDS
jgi:uncharacterized membrane protein